MDSSVLSGLNVNANLSLNGLGFVNPVILENGLPELNEDKVINYLKDKVNLISTIHLAPNHDREVLAFRNVQNSSEMVRK